MPDCEGTGRKINRFDPPVRERFGERNIYLDNRERSPSGYLLEKESCGTCHGMLKVWGLK